MIARTNTKTFRTNSKPFETISKSIDINTKDFESISVLLRSSSSVMSIIELYI